MGWVEVGGGQLVFTGSRERKGWEGRVERTGKGGGGRCEGGEWSWVEGGEEG